MTDHKSKLRLDQILMYEGLITEKQVKQALTDQKERGGKFGSQLLYNGFIDETDLVKALAKQLNCKAVILSNLEIPPKILELIPAKFAVARKVIPFDYDIQKGIVKFACEDPTDKKLFKELTYITGDQKVDLYLAADLALNTSIAKHYLDYDISDLDNYLLELPQIYDEFIFKRFGMDSSGTVVANDSENQQTILIVTDDPVAKPVLTKLFELDNYKVITIDSADDAIESLGSTTYHSVFIQDSVSGDYIDLIDRLRKLSPSTQVRYYESASSLFFDQHVHRDAAELMKQNLELLTSLLTDKDKLEHNHNATVGQYVAKLCSRIELPHKDRAAIINAAFMHDIAKFYYPDEKYDPADVRGPITKTIKLLQSLGYSPVIIGMLSSMYIDLKKKYTKRLPIEALGGNIITICDLFCQSINVNERISYDKFDTIKNKINELTGNLFLTEVASAFIEMVEKEIIHETEKVPFNQIMIYSQNNTLKQNIQTRVQSENFRSVAADNISSFIELYKRSHPDYILMIFDTSADETKNEIDKIVSLGLQFSETPTFVLAKPDTVAQLSTVIELGIEDVLSNEGNIELLIAKLRRIQNNLIMNSTNSNKTLMAQTGTHGLLADMDLIDLIQILGSGNRTIRLTVFKTETSEMPLILFMNRGKITFAQYNDSIGADAVYQAIGWKHGNWKVESIDIDEIPESNNDLPNESILMEGCRLLDETKKVGQDA